MKKSLFALAALAAAGVAQAQSSVTLYGIADAGLRYETHSGNTATNTGANKLSLVGGGMSQSRWGLRGAEDLGGGMKAIFNLEQRVTLDNGTQVGNAFQQAWVGLSTKAGDVTLGRQYNLVFDAVTQNYPSFGYSPYIEVFKPEVGYMLGARADNMVKYAGNFSGVKLGAQYALGEQNQAYGRGSQYGFSLGYAAGPVAIAGAYLSQLSTAASPVRTNAYTLGASFVAGPAKINAGWIGNSAAAGSNNATSNHDNSQVYFGGVTFAATPALNVGGQLWYHRTDSAATNRVVQGAVVVDYALSKRTDAYLQTDYTLRAAKDTTAATYVKPFGATVGLRHRF